MTLPPTQPAFDPFSAGFFAPQPQQTPSLDSDFSQFGFAQASRPQSVQHTANPPVDFFSFEATPQPSNRQTAENQQAPGQSLPVPVQPAPKTQASQGEALEAPQTGQTLSKDLSLIKEVDESSISTPLAANKKDLGFLGHFSQRPDPHLLNSSGLAGLGHQAIGLSQFESVSMSVVEGSPQPADPTQVWSKANTSNILAGITEVSPQEM
jgi:hypothetical protein